MEPADPIEIRNPETPDRIDAKVLAIRRQAVSRPELPHSHYRTWPYRSRQKTDTHDGFACVFGYSDNFRFAFPIGRPAPGSNPVRTNFGSIAIVKRNHHRGRATLRRWLYGVNSEIRRDF